MTDTKAVPKVDKRIKKALLVYMKSISDKPFNVRRRRRRLLSIIAREWMDGSSDELACLMAGTVVAELSGWIDEWDRKKIEGYTEEEDDKIEEMKKNNPIRLLKGICIGYDERLIVDSTREKS